MKVIDLLNMRSEKKELLKEIIVKNTLGNYKFKNVSKLCYVDEEGDYLFSDDYNWFDMLDYDVEIVEEPKEELKEIEELDNRVAFKTTDLESGIEKGTMYKGMEVNVEYTLKELGL